MNINGFIWRITDDVIQHVYDRAEYRDITPQKGHSYVIAAS